MGDHADDVLNGAVCQECFEWFPDVLSGADEPGHPRTCVACEPANTKPVRRRKRRRNRRAGQGAAA